ncbi:formate/nitrite transporter family protein [Aurantimonas marina]|uniref:formate/nitrite transporter family protein n=1 Tax=Aurantimonas marina TaxID=2780508 RepID=UPI0019D19BE2|nr:formate/nitrite transporter family protein [Aurantimonas marina]
MPADISADSQSSHQDLDGERAGNPQKEPGSSNRLRRASAQAIHDAILADGEEELSRPVMALFWSGIAAGLAMGLSLAAEGLLSAGLPKTDWEPLISSFGYTIGFVVVVLGRQQLFTENTLTVVLPVLEQRTLSALGLMLRLWAVILVTNVVGTLLFAAVAAHTDIFSPDAREAFSEIGQKAAEAGFWLTMLRAVVAGWLIALMVWLLPEAGAAKIFVILILTYVISLGDFAHVIAGSAEVAFAAFSGTASWTDYWLGYMLPTLLGNVAGGVTFVAVLNHAQVQSKS